ncbi:cation:proton antiporter [bacterium]|nr:cation:proton antiporter [bacterium]
MQRCTVDTVWANVPQLPSQPEGNHVNVDFSLINLLFIIIVGFVGGTCSSRMGYPPVLGELTAGMIFGPPVFGLVHADDGVHVLGQLGVIFLMVFAGSRIDLPNLVNNARQGLIATLCGFLLTFGLGYAGIRLLGGDSTSGLIVGTIIGTTALASVARIIVDFQLLESRIGQVLMSVAFFSVAVVLIIFAAVSSSVTNGEFSLLSLLTVLAQAILFLVIAGTLGQMVFPQIYRILHRLGIAARTDLYTIVLLKAIALAWLAQALGLHIILGAFMAGMFLHSELFRPGLFNELFAGIRDTALGLLAPIFFVAAGFSVSFGIFTSNLLLLIVIVLAAIIGKVLGGWLAFVINRQDWREGLVVGLGMNGRGGVDVVMAGVSFHQLQAISQDTFTALIFTALITTMIVPPTLKAGLAWLTYTATQRTATDATETSV